MLIGIDDTDSVNGMCTTYLASLICRKLPIKSLPKLVRLNPNIPYKTRGNGAVAIECEHSTVAKKIILTFVEKYSRMEDPKTNPGVVFLEKLGIKKSEQLNAFYRKAVSQLVTIEEAESLAEKTGAELHKFKNGRGIIGALAAVGACLDDKTYELIAYRVSENYGKKRIIDCDKVFSMDSKLYPRVFDNVDRESGQIRITPHGRDPVYCGIRGENPEVVQEAWELIKPQSGIEFTQVFESNQATDAHLVKKKISEIMLYDCVILDGVVSAKPRTLAGGHVFFKLADDSGSVDCAAYEPTGGFRDVVRRLLVGDQVTVWGGVSKYPNTVNLEKINVTCLSDDLVRKTPVCCGKKMSSAGREKGLKCKLCGSRKPTEAIEYYSLPRKIVTGFYEVPPRARRHLSKPLVRMTYAQTH